jgi:methyl-accepting chemotaxis protein
MRDGKKKTLITVYFALLDAQLLIALALINETPNGSAWHRIGWVLAWAAPVLIALVALTLQRQVVNPLQSIAQQLRQMAESGNGLRQRIAWGVDREDDFGELCRSLNAILDRMGGAISEIAESSESLVREVEEICGVTEDVRKEAREQSERIQNVSNSMHQMTACIEEISRGTNHAAGSATEAGAQAHEGAVTADSASDAILRMKKSAGDTRDRIEEVGRAVNGVSEIVGAINQIAARTNMLALNASIQAAQAGKHGAAFAVVATEVHELAKRTADATAQITERLAHIQDKAKNAVDAMRGGSDRVAACVVDTMKASDALKKISVSVDQVQAKVTQIASATTQQSVTVVEINHNMDKFQSMIANFTSQVDQSLAGIDRLKKLAHCVSEKAQGIHADR